MDNNAPIPAPAAPPPGPQREIMIITGILLLICCVAGGLGVSGYFLYQNYQETANAESTAAAATQVQALQLAQSTRQAEGTATARAQATANAQSTQAVFTRATTVAGYEVFEPFDDNARSWRAEVEDNEYWQGLTEISGGVYRWEVNNTMQSFIAWGDPDDSPLVRDFDSTVEARLVSGDNNQVCYGLVFYATRETLDDGAITLSVCESQVYSIDYYDINTGWESLVDWSDTGLIRTGETNTLAMSARDGTFSLSINGEVVGEFTESRIREGYVSMFVTIYDLVPGEVHFDNFALQTR